MVTGWEMLLPTETWPDSLNQPEGQVPGGVGYSGVLGEYILVS